MRVIKWEPFRDVDDVFDRFFAETLRRWPRAGATGQQAKEWAPMADVSETDGEYIIKAELPEVRKEDVNITVQDGVLTLSGERKQEKHDETRRCTASSASTARLRVASRCRRTPTSRAFVPNAATASSRSTFRNRRQGTAAAADRDPLRLDRRPDWRAGARNRALPLSCQRDAGRIPCGMRRRVPTRRLAHV